MSDMPPTAPAPAGDREAVVDYGTGRLELPGELRAGRLVEPERRGSEEAVEAVILPDVSPHLSGPETERELRRRRGDIGVWGLAWATVKWGAGGVGWFIRCLFGIATMILALAVVSAVPVLNFIALGYLLSVEGRVARSGRLRDAFPLVSTLAPRLGSITLGVWIFLLPLRLLAEAGADARIIDAGAPADVFLRILPPVVSVPVTAHLCLALARGGGLLTFFRPLKNVLWFRQQMRSGDYWLRAEASVANFIHGLRLREHFWLGFRGFVGAFLWLVIPTALFAIARRTEGGPILVTLFGGLLLVIVLSWMPFLQAHFAAEDRFSAMFDLRAVRRLYGNSPLCWLLTVVLTLALALPLYLSKVALPPQDAMWMVTLLFIVTIYPVKVLTGWAYHRALTRPRKAFFLWRWFCWLLMFPVIGFYVFVLFFTQFIGEHGKGVLFEHHAFLLPVPF